MSDLYARLGVNRDASLEEIRRAYKELARSNHPDRGGDTEKFKSIQEAHEVLSDEGRRRMYDMTGSVNGQDAPQGGMAAGGIPFHFMGGMGPFGMPGVSFDMGDIFGQMFGGGGPGPRRRRGGKGPNKTHDIGLRLSEFYKGHEIKLKFNQARKCGACSGSGAEATEPCHGCGGSGMKTMMRQIGPGMMAQTRGPCQECNGEGVRVMRPCRVCHGKKMTEREKQLDIRISPGMTDGEQLTFTGECSDSTEFDSPGDVILILRRVDNKDGVLDNFIWTGANLLIRKEISYAESVLGFTMTLHDHPSGNSPKIVWRGGPLIHGAVLQYEGGGMPKKEGGFGTLFLQVMITPPSAVPWSAEDAAKLQTVLGGTATMMEEPGVQTLSISSSSSRLGPTGEAM